MTARARGGEVKGVEWWLRRDRTGLRSLGPGARVPGVGLQCFPDAPLPVSHQLHWGHRSLGTRTLDQSCFPS